MMTDTTKEHSDATTPQEMPTGDRIFTVGNLVPAKIVFSYPMEDDVEVDVKDALDWVDNQKRLWVARRVIWSNGKTSFAKSWWFSGTLRMQRIGAGAYGDILVVKRRGS